MTDTVTIEPAEEIPDGSRIRHYDELDQETKERFPQLTSAADVPVSEPIAEGLRECDVVKFTDYYSITLFQRGS